MTRNLARRAALIGALCILATAAAPAQSVGWPMRGGDPQNSAASRHAGVMDGRLAWTLDRTRVSAGLPAVAPDGTIYVCVSHGGRGELWALRPDSSVIWKAPLLDSSGRLLRSGTTPVIGPDGTIYVGWASFFNGGTNVDPTFQAFDPQGNRLWLYEPKFDQGHPKAQQAVLGPDGTIYTALDSSFGPGGDEFGSLLAIDGATGTLKWRYVTPHRDSFYTGPALGCRVLAATGLRTGRL